MMWKFVEPIRGEEYSDWRAMIYECSNCGYEIGEVGVNNEPEECPGCGEKNKYGGGK